MYPPFCFCFVFLFFAIVGCSLTLGSSIPDEKLTHVLIEMREEHVERGTVCGCAGLERRMDR